MKLITTSQSRYPKILGQDFSSKVFIGFIDHQTNRENSDLVDKAIIELYDMKENTPRTIQIVIKNNSEIPIYVDSPPKKGSHEIIAGELKKIYDVSLVVLKNLFIDDKPVDKEQTHFLKPSQTMTFEVDFQNANYISVFSAIKLSFSNAVWDKQKSQWIRGTATKNKFIGFIHSKVPAFNVEVGKSLYQAVKGIGDAVFGVGGYITEKVVETSPPALRWLLENGQYIVIGVAAILAIGLVMFLLKDD